MAFTNVIRNPLFQLFQSAALWPRLENRVMDVIERITPGFSDDDILAMLFPLEDRTRTDSQLAADLGGH